MFGLGGPMNVLVHALFDKVKKWVCREWSVIAATFPSKKKNKQTNLVCSNSTHKKTPPQIQKYILPKPFTKIKWNSTCSGRVGKKTHTHTKLFKRIVCAQTMHIAIWMQFCFCSWLTPSATVSNSNLSFIRKRAAVQQKRTAFDRNKANTIFLCNLWHVCRCRCRYCHCRCCCCFCPLPHQHSHLEYVAFMSCGRDNKTR